MESSLKQPRWKDGQSYKCDWVESQMLGKTKYLGKFVLGVYGYWPSIHFWTELIKDWVDLEIHWETSLRLGKIQTSVSSLVNYNVKNPAVVNADASSFKHGDSSEEL